MELDELLSMSLDDKIILAEERILYNQNIIEECNDFILDQEDSITKVKDSITQIKKDIEGFEDVLKYLKLSKIS